MKESVTKFDLEAAFKALDEIELPTATEGVKANRPALTEIFSRRSKFESLFEEYYDVGSTAELNDAKDAREAEIAKAKLERIEKIVDLDAKSADDLLTSYVGKYIIQCPQCMTLFYKDKEDIVESEDDPSTVNVNEICQHCGNETGYTLVGKVDDATPEEATEAELNIADEELPTEEIPEEGAEEESTDDLSDLEAIDLDLDLDVEAEEVPEEEKKEEAFAVHSGEALVEDIQDDKELDAKLEAHNEYIEYLRTVISDEEAELEKATNEQVKAAIQRRIDAFKLDLEAALPDAVKNEVSVEDTEEVEEVVDEASVEDAAVEVEESFINEEDKTLTEALHEEAELEVSEDEFKELISTPEFKKPISDTEVRAMINAEKEAEEEVEEALTEGIFDKLKDKITKFTDSLKSRAAKAEWVLNNAMVDYDKAVINDDGSSEANADNRQFNYFIVIGYKDTGKNGQKITAPPMPDSKNLVVGSKYPEVKTKYADAENIAKGTSMQDGFSTAFIYLAKNKDGDGGAFLCQYFKGELDTSTDKLENYMEAIKRNMSGSKLKAKGGADQSDERQLSADKLKKGMKIRLEDGEIEITGVEKVKDPLNGKEAYDISYVVDGKAITRPYPASEVFKVARDSIVNESLDTFMASLDELQEAALEALIADSLVEAYGNVAGFKLSECTYLNEKFNVNGTIYFTSGNQRKTTYSFTEAYLNDGKVSLRGLNEKLGLEKQFVLTGRVDNKTLITESFKCNK